MKAYWSYKDVPSFRPTPHSKASFQSKNLQTDCLHHYSAPPIPAISHPLVTGKLVPSILRSCTHRHNLAMKVDWPPWFSCVRSGKYFLDWCFPTRKKNSFRTQDTTFWPPPTHAITSRSLPRWMCSSCSLLTVSRPPKCTVISGKLSVLK